MSEVINGHFGWAQINTRIKELEDQIESSWSTIELDMAGYEAGICANPRERLEALFRERAQLVKRQREMERKII